MDALVDEEAFVLVRRTKISINVIQEEASELKVLFMTEISDCRDQGKCLEWRGPLHNHISIATCLIRRSLGGSVPFTALYGPGLHEQVVVSAPANH